MNPGVVSGVQSATATVGLESKNDWSKPNDEEDALFILGLWQPDQCFEYALTCGSFKSPSYIARDGLGSR